MAKRTPSARSKRAKQAGPKAKTQPQPSWAAAVRWWWRLDPLARYQLQMTGVAVMATAMVLIAAGLVHSIAQLATVPKQAMAATQTDRLSTNLETASRQLSALEALQASGGGNVVDIAQLQQELSTIKVDLAVGNPAPAGLLLAHLQQQLATGNTKVLASAAGAQPPAANQASLDVPILIYHAPPPDFAQQMDVLQQRSYTTITLDQLAAALVGKAALPPKPVIITLDDGLSSELPAAALLAARHLKATFFIIDGGPATNYCIGATYRPGSCAENYMNWNQVRQLDRNPLFTIGSHTIDHPDLPTLSAAAQSYEIISGKQQLEQQLGHRVDDFAYPYGDLNATTLALVHQAGFIAAVTTQAGTVETPAGLLTLPRIRATYDLP